MASAVASPVSQPPKGYRTTPLRPGDERAPLRAGLVVRASPESPEATPFIRLRDVTDGSVFLGCIEDAGERVLRWLEVWVQHTENLGATRPGYRDALCNHTLDERWKAMARNVAALDPEAFIETGWENAHPRPLLFDPASGALFHPGDSDSGAGWELCTDDSRLAAAGLPPYSVSLARYLVLNDGTGDRFAPLTPDAPTTGDTVSMADLLNGARAFNLGGLMMLRFLAPLDLGEWIDILSGEPWNGLPCGRRPVPLGGAYATLGDIGAMRHGGGHLLLGARGAGGRLLEAFHLKLQTVAAAFRIVRRAVRDTQRPFLNLRAESFGVRLRGLDSGLPILWASETSLAVPGDAVALAVETTESRYFVPSDFGETSIYRPAEAGVPVKGHGEVRIRKVLPESGETTRVEATLVTQERLAASRNDLLWLNVPLADGHVGLYGRIETDGSGVRFRSEPQKLEAPVVAALRQTEGAPLPNVPFELVPLLSSPCDLYALGVLAVRALLVDDANTLPVALDELHSLARAVAGVEAGGASFASRLAQAAGAEVRWREALGPHRLLRDELGVDDALAAFSPTLWWETLAWIVRLFPGVVPESFCRDFADAPAPALETAFGAPLDELDALLLRSRSMIVSDVHAHREVRAVIDSFLVST